MSEAKIRVSSGKAWESEKELDLRKRRKWNKIVGDASILWKHSENNTVGHIKGWRQRALHLSVEGEVYKPYNLWQMKCFCAMFIRHLFQADLHVFSVKNVALCSKYINKN
jgi:hypothetical protein